MALSVSCRLLENYQIQVLTDRHTWVVDEPGDIGGDGLGPNPFELLLGSLGSCLSITIAYFAGQSKVPLEKLIVDMSGEWEESDDEKTYKIDVTVKVRGDLDETDIKKIEKFAERCPVHTILSDCVKLKTEIVQV